MSGSNLLWPILLPAAAGLLVLLIRKAGVLRDAVALLAAAANLVVAVLFFQQALPGTGQEVHWAPAWAGFGISFSLRLYQFSAFILAAVAGFGLLVTLYSWKFMRNHRSAAQYYAYLLISLAMAAGAVLADHLIAMLFFWEGLLVTLFGMIAIGREGAWKTATKAFIIVGVTDVCLMAGIALAGRSAGTFVMSEMAKAHVPLDAIGSLAMVLMMIGAMAKAGAMPFHSWIPDAAVDAPLPFMAFLPAALEKLLGIYLLARITLDIFALTPGSWLSTLMMIVGALTILLAVMMALVQKDYKRLLSYHAISQVGYMILGIGTAVPVGIVGGLFHMINHAMYKSCLFLTGGAVEKQAGTTDLSKLGGLAAKMPITFICFLVAAASISGVPPFNGFFSKELVYDGALERGMVFYLAAILGSFLTAASFLKLGHAAYCGKRSAEHEGVKEAPLSMLVPMIVIAALCVLFGVCNSLPLKNLIVPILPAGMADGHHFGGMPENGLLVAVTLIFLALAVVNHWIGVRLGGSGLHASDHIRYAHGLAGIYDRAEKRFFDPYDLGRPVVAGFARVLWWVDRGIDWVYDGFSVKSIFALARGVRAAHTGSYALYVLWSLAGAVAILFFLVKSV